MAAKTTQDKSEECCKASLMKFLVFYGELGRESETYPFKTEDDDRQRDTSMSMCQSRRQSKTNKDRGKQRGYRGLNAFIVIKIAARKRLKAYKSRPIARRFANNVLVYDPRNELYFASCWLLTRYRSAITSLLAEVSEVLRHRHLSANITKLAPDAEEVVLLAEGTSIFTRDIFFLQMHIGIRDFWYRSQIKEDD